MSLFCRGSSTCICLFVELSKCLSQFILKKFLLLVLFLDRAKLTRLIDFDPCLFQKSSRIKVNQSN